MYAILGFALKLPKICGIFGTDPKDLLENDARLCHNPVIFETAVLAYSNSHYESVLVF